jgi:hypothetical protein
MDGFQQQRQENRDIRMLAMNDQTSEQLESTLRETTQKIYQISGRTLIPLYPYVLLRMLNKTQNYHGILTLPESNQNKTVHEGIILCTWRPRRVEQTRIYKDDRGEFTRAVIERSHLNPGDHVLIPHWVGIPAYGLDPLRYRFVKEKDWDITKDGGVLAVVEYDEPDDTPFQKLLKILGNDTEGILLARKIQDEFLLVDRSRGSVTLSGV